MEIIDNKAPSVVIFPCIGRLLLTAIIGESCNY